MGKSIYSFVGAATALRFYFNSAKASDQERAATSDLQKVSEQLMSKVVGDTTEESFKALLDEHVVTLLESLEVVRASEAYQGLDQALRDLLDGFYALADSLMGGGGCDLDHGLGAACYTSFTE